METGFMPHGMCYLWYPEILFLHISSDAVIGIAYMAISAILAYMLNRRAEIPFRPIFILFGCFIFACGLTHFFSIWTVWNPNYVVQGTLKAVTAAISLITAAVLYPLLPKVFALRSASELEAINVRLADEIAEHEKTQAMLRRSQAELEQRVAHRTQELVKSNSLLGDQVKERERTHEVMSLQQEKLVQSNEALTHFAYVASHDLKEPVRLVSNYLQLLSRRSGDRLDETATHYIAKATGSALRMHSLLEGLLEYSRAGNYDDSLVEVDTMEVLDSVKQDLAIAIQETDGQILANSLPKITTDAMAFRLLLQNLVSNALKFCHESIAPQVTIEAQLDGSFWRFSVSDNGIGVDPQFYERIFKVFQRLHTRDSIPGVGIGLSICTRITQSLGGRIWVESKPGEGTCFYFTLPATELAA